MLRQLTKLPTRQISPWSPIAEFGEGEMPNGGRQLGKERKVVIELEKRKT